MDELKNGINSVLRQAGMGNSSSTTIENMGLTITLANDAFFQSGSADISSTMKDGLGRLAKLLNRVKNPILIEGHTDNVPISGNGLYSSNWQLSATRAANVADYLNQSEQIKGSRLRAVGYGEFHPIASNDTEQGRKKNRRVEITILYNEDTGMMFNEN
jgi:chemotaxis protein MotB